MSALQEIAPGLHRWTAFHEQWNEEVGCLALETGDGLVLGDVLLGAGAKPGATDDSLRLCPERWLGDKTHEDLRASLRPLLSLPVRRVLVSHGEPLLRGGKAALTSALGR